MSAGDKVFAGSIPGNYDRDLVPLIFESYARDISRRAAALSPKAVLETAAGSGVVTRALAPKLSADAIKGFADFLIRSQVIPQPPTVLLAAAPHAAKEGIA